jgi:hypothetical protein
MDMDQEQQYLEMESMPHNPCVAYNDDGEPINPDPKMYGPYPSCYVQKIVPAGKITYKSEGVYNIIS